MRDDQRIGAVTRGRGDVSGAVVRGAAADVVPGRTSAAAPSSATVAVTEVRAYTWTPCVDRSQTGRE